MRKLVENLKSIKTAKQNVHMIRYPYSRLWTWSNERKPCEVPVTPRACKVSVYMLHQLEYTIGDDKLTNNHDKLINTGPTCYSQRNRCY